MQELDTELIENSLQHEREVEPSHFDIEAVLVPENVILGEE